jgi:hypothetical protein
MYEPLTIPSIHVMPAARQIQPMGFPGRLEAIRAPTIGKGRKGNIAHNGVLMPPVPQLRGCRTGRVAICRATATRNKTTQSSASDQASHEMARGLIPLAPCSRAWFPRSRHYSTALLSPKRYGKRYEDEMPVVKFELIGPEATMRANHLPGRACRPV